jgi:hypothetical protein
VRSRALAAIGMTVLSSLLVGCNGGPSSSPEGMSNQGAYEGSDAATLTIIGFDVGCCFMEGSLHFARLEGPTNREWTMDQPLPLASPFDPNAPREVGSEAFGIKPADYAATFWQRPCDANCGNLDPVASQCRITFTAQAGARIRIDVSFPLQKQCTAVVS